MRRASSSASLRPKSASKSADIRSVFAQTLTRTFFFARQQHQRRFLMSSLIISNDLTGAGLKLGVASTSLKATVTVKAADAAASVRCFCCWSQCICRNAARPVCCHFWLDLPIVFPRHVHFGRVRFVQVLVASFSLDRGVFAPSAPLFERSLTLAVRRSTAVQIRRRRRCEAGADGA